MKKIPIDLDYFQEKLEYKFKNLKLLKDALTHPSYLSHQSVAYFERLEFLGDKVVGLAITELLFTNFSKEDEGKLSVRYSNSVNKYALFDVLQRLGVIEHIPLLNDCKTVAVYADICEAIIGAIFIDSNYETAKNFMIKWWIFDNSEKKDPKSALQEYLQNKGLRIPEYSFEKQENGEFFMKVISKDLDIAAIGTGHNKKMAEHQAAKKLLDEIKQKKKAN